MPRTRYAVALAIIAIASMPSGHLWGWLLDEHDAVGQDVPQKGPWFLPPFAVKAK